VANKTISAKTLRPAAPKAAVKTAVLKKAAPKKTPLTVSIDYPQDGEAVRSGHYSIRLTAAGASQAQGRFDGEEWLDFREAIGHFWLDWAPRERTLDRRARARRRRRGLARAAFEAV
jgi:hypothetical protein